MSQETIVPMGQDGNLPRPESIIRISNLGAGIGVPYHKYSSIPDVTPFLESMVVALSALLFKLTFTGVGVTKLATIFHNKMDKIRVLGHLWYFCALYSSISAAL